MPHSPAHTCRSVTVYVSRRKAPPIYAAVIHSLCAACRRLASHGLPPRSCTARPVVFRGHMCRFVCSCHLDHLLVSAEGKRSQNSRLPRTARNKWRSLLFCLLVFMKMPAPLRSIAKTVLRDPHTVSAKQTKPGKMRKIHGDFAENSYIFIHYTLTRADYFVIIVAHGGDFPAACALQIDFQTIATGLLIVRGLPPRRQLHTQKALASVAFRRVCILLLFSRPRGRVKGGRHPSFLLFLACAFLHTKTDFENKSLHAAVNPEQTGAVRPHNGGTF